MNPRGRGTAIDFDSPEKSNELFKKGKKEGTWDPDDTDLGQDQADWEGFDVAERETFLGIASGIYEGEEDVTPTLAPYMYALEGLEDDPPVDPVQEELSLSQQVYEEAKHTDFFSRYFELVAGTQDLEPYQDDDGGGYSIKDLYDKAEEVGRDVILPGFQEGIGRVRQEETRHIENGRWVLERLADAEPDIVADVYEPRMQADIDHQLLDDDQPEFDRAYPGFDGKKIFSKSQQFLQDTIDYVGRDRFDVLTDVESTVRDAMAAAD